MLTTRQRDAINGAIVDAKHRLQRLTAQLDERRRSGSEVDHYSRWIAEAEGDIEALSSILDGSDVDPVRLRAELDAFPSFAEVYDMGDRLAPLADRLEALGMTKDAETIRLIIDPHSTIGELRLQNAKLSKLYHAHLIESAEHCGGD